MFLEVWFRGVREKWIGVLDKGCLYGFFFFGDIWKFRFFLSILVFEGREVFRILVFRVEV